MMMKLGEIYLSEELTQKLEEKLEQYNKAHPADERISYQKLAEMFLEYGIRYLDVSAID